MPVLTLHWLLLYKISMRIVTNSYLNKTKLLKLVLRSLKLPQHLEDTDKDRTSMLPFVFYDTFGFEQYVDCALEVPMYFVNRKKKYIDCTGMSFKVRLRRYLEMRGADGGPMKSLCAGFGFGFAFFFLWILIAA
ncbi:unnamed protein product [Trifolium pratense]|uniref:Uncharacterized protein n=1 Tax=Trifolium pratense TaxID=57577 RepID=A0ACB0L5W7_TRIPR|nr:unnamed protein product [Trifolium pratense]